ncbi:LIC20035 family adhesin [Leptospira sp. GIMC2001]|uniref:LIC20035 family adhesin n=1 Tax=Leptospira sp. GIMC2001 TaxID=1513297 RepID=UPI00234B9D07|nr:LIC20035 family adhesin [Leptospira sp. GIMC2001]WCL47621.1 LIC20035 family adhesin [Leptospira sp. GIMC2001]
MKFKIPSLLILTMSFLIQCGGGDTKEPEKGIPDFEMKAPNIRIERFSNTKLIRGQGPVLTDCGGKPCDSKQLETLGIVKIKAFPKHGEWKEYLQFQDGGDLKNPKFKNVLDLVGTYENGKRVGVWKRPNAETGKIIAEIPYTDGKRQGTMKTYGENGQLISETEYVDDKMHGSYYLKAAKDGNFLEKGQYKEGEKHGLWTTFHFGKGTIKQLSNYQNGALNGEEKNFYDDGKTVSSMGMNRDDARVGTWKTFYPDGKLQSEGSYAPKDGGTGDSKYERVGIWREYYPNGQLFAEGPRKHVRNGKWNYYYNDGKLRYRGIMANEVMLQSAEVFDRSGLKIGEGKFFFSIVAIDDKTGDLKDSYKPDIPFTYYHDNGKKRLEIRSSEDAIEYDKNGKEIGRGGGDAQGRKNGCWKEGGKTVYYMLGKERATMTANACGGS